MYSLIIIKFCKIKRIIDFNKNWVVIMTLFLGMCFVSLCYVLIMLSLSIPQTNHP